MPSFAGWAWPPVSRPWTTEWSGPAAHRRGLSTVLADTDPQGSSTEVFKARADDGPRLVSSTGEGLRQVQQESEALWSDVPNWLHGRRTIDQVCPPSYPVR